jgi:glycine/serine hydroxymethyltransferase
MTTRGFGEAEMRQVGRWIAEVVHEPDDVALLAAHQACRERPVRTISVARRNSPQPNHLTEPSGWRTG